MSKSSREFYCTCQIKHYTNSSKRRDESRHLKFHRTEVDDDECCVHCGYYAWERPIHRLYPRRSTVPWRDDVCEERGWTGNTELRDAYFKKTVYSDYELDLGDAFDSSAISGYSLEEELGSCYVRWGGNNHE